MSKKNDSSKNLEFDEDSYSREDVYKDILGCIKVQIPFDKLDRSIHIIEKELDLLSEAKKHAILVLKEELFIGAYMEWARRRHLAPFELVNYPKFNYRKILIEKELIPFKDLDRFILIKNVNRESLLNALESIRCIKDMDIFHRENLVSVFLRFIKWMSEEISSNDISGWLSGIQPHTFNIEDPDKIKTKGRILEFNDFIKFLSHLDKRYQLVAKLLYFGGSRTMDQVVNLQIKDVVFDKQVIIFDEIEINYPRHVLEDMRLLLDGRKKGNVFIGRQDTPLNPATIFRNFKEAALKVPLDHTFSPKTLTTNR